MLIETSGLRKGSLEGEVAVVTGGGRGIGYEAARALLWLGARVIIAEIDEATGAKAAAALAEKFGQDRVLFVRTDVGDEEDITKLRQAALDKFGGVNIVLNNATIFPMGAVKDVPIESWDRSYRVNLRGPVLLARTFLPEMVRSRHGTFVCVSSSGAAPFMGAYEVFKTAQVELANTISAEVEDKGVFAFTIGPGIVPTPGFMDGGSQVAALMGMTIEELMRMNEAAQLTPEAAGLGFAGSIALASKYHGSEISSIQVLKDIGVDLAPSTRESTKEQADYERAMPLMQKVRATYAEQSEGWKKRNLFERQWVYRDFKKQTGVSVDEMLAILQEADLKLKQNAPVEAHIGALEHLKQYYAHQQELLRGFEKDPKKQEAGLKAIDTWVLDLKALMEALKG